MIGSPRFGPPLCRYQAGPRYPCVLPHPPRMNFSRFPVKPPVRVPRYDIKSHGARSDVTIVAGFVNQNGVVLCTDTQYTISGVKYLGLKSEEIICPGGKVAIAYAGNVEVAQAAIYATGMRLQSVQPTDTLPELTRFLDEEYTRSVGQDPNSRWYDLIVAHWSNVDKTARLYATNANALRPIHIYDCIGIGRLLAHYLVRSHCYPGISERMCLSLAAYMLVNVKDYVDGCGGPSHYHVIRHTGETIRGSAAEVGVEHLEIYAKGLDAGMRRLMLVMSSGIDEKEFERELSDHSDSIRAIWYAFQKVGALLVAPKLPQ